jgi:hypothetical protein
MSVSRTHAQVDQRSRAAINTWARKNKIDAHRRNTTSKALETEMKIMWRFLVS